MENKKTSGSVGIGGILQIAFIILKLCGVIAWNWWRVPAPIWISLGLAVILGIIIFCVKSRKH